MPTNGDFGVGSLAAFLVTKQILYLIGWCNGKLQHWEINKRTLDDKESRSYLSLLLFALLSLKRSSIFSLQPAGEKDAWFQHLLIPLTG